MIAKRRSINQGLYLLALPKKKIKLNIFHSKSRVPQRRSWEGKSSVRMEVLMGKGKANKEVSMQEASKLISKMICTPIASILRTHEEDPIYYQKREIIRLVYD